MSADIPTRSSNQPLRDDANVEHRDRHLDDAFNAPQSLVEINAKSFIEALIHVLRYHGGVCTRKDHGEIGNDQTFRKASGHFTYVFRHSLLMRDDGSLSRNEIFNHSGSIRKIKQCNNRDASPKLTAVDQDELRRGTQGKLNSIRFLMPLAHILANSNKSRFQLGYHTKETFSPGTLVPEETWFSVAQFHQEAQREQQATFLESLEIASVFIRTESGHSNEVDIKHPSFDSSRCPNRYLIRFMARMNRTCNRSAIADCSLGALAKAGITCTSF